MDTKKYERIKNKIVSWLKDQIELSNQKGFVLGISGGVDSAVVSTLCAMTGKPVLCLSMPIHQEPGQLIRADAHGAWLKDKFGGSVKYETVDLTDFFEAGKKTLTQSFQTELSLANMRSRCRMTTLYGYANSLGFLVAGTGNKVEDFGVFFCTKWGDSAVDLSPIGDLMKTEVWELSEYLGIAESICKAKPADGLWGDNRSDEDQLGASYPDLEWAMKEQEQGRINKDNLSMSKGEIWDIYVKWHSKGLHKSKPIPICYLTQ